MDIENLIVLQVMMFLIMAVGLFCYKKGIITPQAKKSMTDLIVTIILPCNIISSFNVEMDPKVLSSSAIIIGIALGVQVFCVILSRVLYRKTEHRQRMVLQYATICSNAGFLGNPVVEGIYGAEGQLYGSIYLIPLRIAMWSVGLSSFIPAKGKDVIKNLATHPCILATIGGFLWMLSGIPLPAVALKTLDTVGSCTTAMSALVIGAILAEVDLKTVITKMTLYFCFIRLILIPGALLAVGLALHMDPFLLGISVVLAGMPAGMSTAILATKYDGDAEYASKCICLSTLLSMVTVPVFCIILQYFS